MDMSMMLDFPALKAATVQHEPFDHLVVPGFLKPEAVAAVEADFPVIEQPGSFPLKSLTYGDAFRRLSEALQGAELAKALGDKFNMNLINQPSMLTVRGQCKPTDGQIHTDSTGKLITVLVYVNDSWNADGGRLRLLRSADDIEDYAAEVPPHAGTMLAFRCSENAWHGHKPFDGQRRSMQLNWVRDTAYLRKEQFRHRISALLKKVRFG
jgi:SM-20-related protein